MDEFQGELNSEGIIAEDKFLTPDSKKKFLLIAAVTGGLILLLIIIIILITSSKGSTTNKKYGEIICQYDISDTNSYVQILGDKFNNLNKLGIFIDKNQTKSSRTALFKKTGINEVIFEIYSQSINLDYMFQDIPELIYVNLTSNNNIKIDSMISTFENCGNLNNFYIKGFNLDNVKSMKNLFSNSKISDFTGLSTKNVEDFSYMFASIDASYIELDNIDTSNAKNMSHMFENTNVNSLIQEKLRICLICLKEVKGY